MQTVAEIRSLLMSRASNAEQRRMILDMARQYIRETEDVKDDYLMALLFPEYAPNVRIPSPFGLPSTLHTQKQEAFLTTNASGTGMLVFTLQDLHWNLVYATNNVPSGTSGMGNFSIDGHQVNMYCPDIYSQRYLPNLFSHARVVGASVRISYIGQMDDEQGFMVGSHIQNQNIVGITDRDIEDGYHVKRVRPSQGLRMTYTPFDDKDFQYCELNTRVVFDKNLSSTLYKDWGVTGQSPYKDYKSYQVQPNDLMYTYIQSTAQPESIGANSLQVQMRCITPQTVPTTTITTANDNANMEIDTMQPSLATGSNQVIWLDLGITNTGETGFAPAYNPVNFVGMGPRAGQITSQFPQICAMYYKGLPPSTQCLRIDIVRHLECIPRSENKAFMSVERPQFCDSTQKLAAQLQHKQSALQVTSLVEAPKVLAITGTSLMNTTKSHQVLDSIGIVDENERWGPALESDVGSSFLSSAYNTFVPLVAAGAGGLAGYRFGGSQGAIIGANAGYTLAGGSGQLIPYTSGGGTTTGQYSKPYTGGGTWGNGAQVFTM